MFIAVTKIIEVLYLRITLTMGILEK